MNSQETVVVPLYLAGASTMQGHFARFFHLLRIFFIDFEAFDRKLAAAINLDPLFSARIIL